MPQYSHYSGILSLIPEDSSAGLLFLKQYLPLIDSSNPLIMDAVSPDASLITNDSPPLKFSDVLPMFSKRAEMLDHFSHADFPVEAWDLEELNGKRTVIYSSISRCVFPFLLLEALENLTDICSSVFKGSSDGIDCREMSVCRLVRAPEGKGIQNLWLVQATNFLNLSKFAARNKEAAKSD